MASDEILNGKITQSFHNARKDIVRKRIELVGKYFQNDSTVLDIGAGAGTFAQAVKNMVREIECLELDARLINEITRLKMHVYTDPFEACEFDKGYDIITAWHVVEHVLYGNEFIEKVFKCLNVGGIFIAEIPTDRKMRNNKSGYDGHIHHYSNESFRHIIEKHGFSIKSVVDGIQKPATLIIGKKHDNH